VVAYDARARAEAVSPITRAELLKMKGLVVGFRTPRRA
jgi:hypothetical protein